ncbi:helix-turn-helix transcriptional regulator [Mucilaginibacter psychrotolerans]|uniref:Helix-turn-helix domain-containing protein n=1 Tax=Mucilaginibacter psychrotolerans TaxID=1524096 RepID=A0A4Y8SB95_9SPHI|nr:helix-turn-helix transcriptional regulator [Mucilaginibacter psychrotolerans]TFF36299.1 helix-turn-helix domain-containing protein [Mucilaginibacter psychrotolerans]
MPVLTAPEKNVIANYPLLGDNGAPAMIQVRESDGVEPIIDPGFLQPHRKQFFMFVLVEQGSSRHWIDDVPYTVKPGHFYFTVPQQIQLKEEICPMEGLVITFTEEFLLLEENLMLRRLPIIQNPAAAHELVLAPEEFAYVQDIMRKMNAEYRANSSWRNQMLASWLQVLVIYLSRLYAEQYGEGCKITQGQCLLKSFQQLITEHHTHQHEVAGYASLLNLTPGYFNDVIKQQSGKTAISHIHSRLVMEAKRRLLHTELSVKQIADELGFEDATYFNRFFKRLADATPMAYRQQIREMYS